MRKGYPLQRRLDSVPIGRVELNLECRDRMIPVLRALQQVYTKPDVLAGILKLIESDANLDTHKDRGREGMDYWQILVLGSVRLGCNFTYDHLQDLAENHHLRWTRKTGPGNKVVFPVFVFGGEECQ